MKSVLALFLVTLLCFQFANGAINAVDEQDKSSSADSLLPSLLQSSRVNLLRVQPTEERQQQPRQQERQESQQPQFDYYDAAREEDRRQELRRQFAPRAMVLPAEAGSRFFQDRATRFRPPTGQDARARAVVDGDTYDDTMPTQPQQSRFPANFQFPPQQPKTEGEPGGDQWGVIVRPAEPVIPIPVVDSSVEKEEEKAVTDGFGKDLSRTKVTESAIGAQTQTSTEKSVTEATEATEEQPTTEQNEEKKEEVTDEPNAEKKDEVTAEPEKEKEEDTETATTESPKEEEQESVSDKTEAATESPKPEEKEEATEKAENATEKPEESATSETTEKVDIVDEEVETKTTEEPKEEKPETTTEEATKKEATDQTEKPTTTDEPINIPVIAHRFNRAK